MNPQDMKIETVVNWHITEVCNYQCSYCFAKWQSKQCNEILHNPAAVTCLLDELEKLPSLLCQKTGLPFHGIRLNLVGGETFLYKQSILYIIEQARLHNFKLSAITNGSCLDNALIELIAKEFSSLGFSIDSLCDETNLKIGRSLKGVPMSITQVMENIEHLRQINSDIDIKINTVVSELNYKEDFNLFINGVNPSKWKVFKMLPVRTYQYSISDDDFYDFVERHGNLKNILSSENNDEMTDSYLMIDPMGRFFQNTNTHLTGYKYSCEIIQHGIEVAINDINFDATKFKHRYQHIQTFSL